MMLMLGVLNMDTDLNTIDLGFGTETLLQKRERLVVLLSDVFIESNQTWYPPSILEHSIKHGTYHLNDEAFMCIKLKKNQIADANILDSLIINNPAQVWVNPQYSNHNNFNAEEQQKAYYRVYKYLQMPQFIQKFNDLVCFEGRIPYAIPEYGKDYMQEYMKNMHAMQSKCVNKKKFLQRWNFVNYECTLFAEIKRRKGKYITTATTFRQYLNSN